MKYSEAGWLLGEYLDERLDEPDESIWPLVAEFADTSPRSARAAVREIGDWLSRASDDDELLELYLAAEGNYGPDPAQLSLRQLLEQVRAFLADRTESLLSRAQAGITWLPADTVTSIALRAGTGGIDWMHRLPNRLLDVEQRWSLRRGELFESPWGYVGGATRSDGSPAVLKIRRALFGEMRALAAFEGPGTVRLLESDLDAEAMLIERAVPGSPLSTLVATDDVLATEVVAHVLQLLWRPAPESHANGGLDFRRRFAEVGALRSPIRNYGRFFEDRGPIPLALVTDAGRVLQDLLASAPEQPTLLHGDLHHGNILSSDRAPGGWLAIDPKGWVGDPGYDVGALLYNPLGYVADVPDLAGLLDRRLRQLSEQLGMDEERLRAWGFVKAVAAEVWFVEDDGATHGVPLRVAETLRSRL